jgi:hypothetical protein
MIKMLSTVIFVQSLLLAGAAIAQTPSANCPESPQSYLEQFAATRKPMPMVCYQYAVQRDPSAVGAISVETSPGSKQRVTDVFGRRVRDNKLIFDEVWRPLPGFEKIFYDTKTLSRYYIGGRTMLQIMGTSTLGDNPFKVSVLVNCYEVTLRYDGVARRRTRVYAYDKQYQLQGNFPKEKIQQICDAFGDQPVLIEPQQ